METTLDYVLLPHVGWMRYEVGDAVAKFLRQGWFESEEQAFLWLYLRAGDSVVDCGAHAGLFAVLAGKIVGTGGRVVAVEPSAVTAQLLRENLSENGVAGTVFECAAGAAAGRMSFADEGEGKSAYNHVEAGGGGASVAVEPLDGLLGSAGMGRVDFLKIDVEGAELEVWAGARGLIERGALGVVMVEFTEANLARVGKSTEELYKAIEASGFTLHRFDAASGQLVVRPFDGVIWYENLFAVRAEILAGVNKRLREADVERRRVAWDVIRRGIAGWPARDADENTKRMREVEAARAGLVGELENAREEIGRAELQMSQLRARLEEADRRAERQEADLTALSAEHDTLRAQFEDVSGRLKKSREEAKRNATRLHSFCVSKYERLSWALHIRSKPHWVDEVLADHGGRPNDGGDMTRRP